MSIQENNKLIAEFMGAENAYKSDIFPHGNYYHSWDWLMPVKKKINSIELDCDTGCGLLNEINEAIEDVDIKRAYKAVVKFIKWCNNKENKE